MYLDISKINTVFPNRVNPVKKDSIDIYSIYKQAQLAHEILSKLFLDSPENRKNKGLKDRWYLNAGRKYYRMLSCSKRHTCLSVCHKPTLLFT